MGAGPSRDNNEGSYSLFMSPCLTDNVCCEKKKTAANANAEQPHLQRFPPKELPPAPPYPGKSLYDPPKQPEPVRGIMAPTEFGKWHTALPRGGKPGNLRGLHPPPDYPVQQSRPSASAGRTSATVDQDAAVRLVAAFFDARHEGDTQAALLMIADDAEWLYPNPFPPAIGKNAVAETSILKTPVVEAPQPAMVVVPFSVDPTLSTPDVTVVIREVNVKMGYVRYCARNELHVEMRQDRVLGERMLITKHRLTGSRGWKVR